MFQNGPSQGGAFKAAGTSGQFNHAHASQMAHGAAARLANARALGGARGAPAAAPASSPMAGSGAPQGRHGGDWRAGVSAMAAHGAGVSVGPNEIHQAVGKLVQTGHLTPFQGQSLVQHHGPLVGAAGHKTMAKIAHVAVGGPIPAPPMPQGGPPQMPQGGPPQMPQGGPQRPPMMPQPGVVA